MTLQRPATAPGADVLVEREKSENFPVALAVLPRRHREALHAVYAFARTVDDVGDRSSGDRAALLHALDQQVTRTWAGEHLGDPVFDRLRSTVAGRVPERYFHDLVQANLQDQVVSRYPTFDSLVGYCRLSADPVGRIVLAIFGQHAEPMLQLSDRVCTALQLLEHWQDVAEDRRAGRVYLPATDLLAYGVPDSDLLGTSATPALARLMRFEIERAAGILAAGTPLLGHLGGWAKVCTAGYVAGGQATVSALRRTGGDVLGRTGTPSRAGTAVRLLGLLAAPGRSRR